MSVDKTLRQAAKLAARGERTAAAQLYREVLAKFPANVQARQGLAALSGPAQPVRRGPGPAPRPAAPGLAVPPQQIAALTQMLQRGQAARVVAEGQRLALLFPKAPALLNLVAMALSQLGKLEESIAWSDRVIAADPRFAGAHVNKGAALARLGRYAEVEKEARAAIALDPRQPQALLLLGYALVNTGRPEEALAPFREAATLAPNDATIQIGLGNALSAANRHAEALPVFERALELAPGNVDVVNNLGNSLAAAGRTDEAVDRLGAAVEASPRQAVLRLNLARALRDQGRVPEAVEQCRAAIDLEANNIEAWALLAHCEHELGNKPATLEAAERVEALSPGNRQMLALRWKVAGHGTDHPDFPDLVAKAEEKDLDLGDRIAIDLTLFSAYDRAGETDLAFAHLRRAKDGRRALEPYSIEDQHALFDAIKDAFTGPMDGLTEADLAELPAVHRPVFIAGMPRSGTSLTEQILASHSQVHGGGELPGVNRGLQSAGWSTGLIGDRPNRQNLRDLREFYLQSLVRLGTDKPVVTDKTPLNFRWIGFMLEAMPECRIIVTRRDSRATCWSNYSNSFVGKANNFGHTMEDTAEMYRMHLDLIDFWRERYPGQIYTLPYEQLTEHQEEESRKLVAAAGLDWEPACLDFHKTERSVRTVSALQVRQKMYTGSSEAWRRYESHLAPMLEGLKGLDPE